MEKKNKKISWVWIILVIIFLALISSYSSERRDEKKSIKRYLGDYSNKTFNILASQENEPLEEIVEGYAKKQGYDVNFEYAGSLEIMQKLNNDSSEYDAVWLSNSIWGYMLENTSTLSNSKCTSINPVIFGIKKSKAQELGLVGKEVYTQDILNAISSGKLKFSMSNPTTTNSGASAYLGLLSTMAGNPEVLTEEILNNEELKGKIKTVFSGLERSSGDEDFLEELFLNGDYEAVVTYESSIININKKLSNQNKEPLYAVYPVDGVSISDAPFAYIKNSDSSKKEIFTDIQQYLLSDEGQSLLQQYGKRTWYGGVNKNADKTIFNPDWGIDTTKYISPLKYPSKDVIKLALNLYQTELRKPVHVAFCLDYSGSMSGTGIKELINAMRYILTDKASSDYIQFSDKDKIDIIPFSSDVGSVWSTTNGTDTAGILKNIESEKTTGTTALYPAAMKALEILKDEDQNVYNTSVILMTDGNGNVGTYRELEAYYKTINKAIPIYSIMFGSASQRQLGQMANLTNAKIFDGKEDLVQAFKEVRGYN